MSVTVSNAQKFRQVLTERNITQQQLDTMIGKFAAKRYLSPKLVITDRESLKKNLRQAAFTDKLLIIGLKIIGLSETEIKSIIS